MTKIKHLFLSWSASTETFSPKRRLCAMVLTCLLVLGLYIGQANAARIILINHTDLEIQLIYKTKFWPTGVDRSYISVKGKGRAVKDDVVNHFYGYYWLQHKKNGEWVTYTNDPDSRYCINCVNRNPLDADLPLKFNAIFTVSGKHEEVCTWSWGCHQYFIPEVKVELY